jgi:hypothetical protein
VDVPDGGLAAIRRRQKQANQTRLEDVGPIRVPWLKGNRSGRIADAAAVDENPLPTIARQAIQEGSAAKIDDRVPSP